MEKILIINSPLGKDTAQKISKVLSGEKFFTTLGARTLEGEKKLPDMVIAVIDKESDKDSSMIKIMKECSQKNISVILFVSYIPETESISNNFFYDEHIWIDNTENFDEAKKSLIHLLKNEYSELSKRIDRKQQQSKPVSKNPAATTSNNKSKPSNAQASSKENLYKNILILCAAVIVVLLFILINGGLKQTNREADNYRANSNPQNSQSGGSDVKIQLATQLKNSENDFVGHWKLSDYSDNQFRRTREDSLSLQALINELKTKAQLIFNADKTFQRLGFSESPETGNWEYDPQARYLKLQAANVNQYDVVQIQEISATRLIIVVQEKIETGEVLTKLTFEKIR